MAWIPKSRRPKSVKATRKVGGRTYRFRGATLAVDGKGAANKKAKEIRERDGVNVRVVRVKPPKKKGQPRGAGGYALYEAPKKKRTAKRTTKKKKR